MKHDYSKLDAAILGQINGVAPVMFWALAHVMAVAEESHKIANANNAGKAERLKTPPWRFVDRRLQALRKAGHIRYQRKPEGWVLVEAA